jgi:ABC-type transport system substrate-binding protein
LKSSVIDDTAAGAMLAFLTFILVFSSVPIQPVAAAPDSLFSMTLLAPTSNPARRQWAAIITNSFQSVGIDAKLVFTGFGPLIGRIWPDSCPCGLLYDKGGYDAVFIGWGGGGVVPDLATLTNYRFATANDVPNIGNNYAFYKNDTLNQLMLTYAQTFDEAQRLKLAQQAVRIVAEDRPYLIIYYPAEVFAFANYLHPWGRQDVYTTSTVPDIEHWRIEAGRGDAVNIGITGDVNSLNPVPTGPSNSLYNHWVFGESGNFGSSSPCTTCLKALDARTLGFYNALATSITSSTDKLTWTVQIRSGVEFHTSASLTADDFIFTYMSDLRSDVGYVSLGNLQTILGLNTEFTFLNGTTRYIMNGTYSASKPANFTKADTSFKALTPTSFTFTMSTPYAFTDPALFLTAPLPMHILEKLPANTWQTSWFSTLQKTPITVTWDNNKFGGNGSYSWAYGPIGAGPYVYKGYDTVAGVGTLVRYDNYWNATGLQTLGQFGVKTIRVIHIEGKDAALAAFKNGQINVMDVNYRFNKDDIQTIKSLGGATITAVDPGSGWQELGFNMNHPIFGTGADTPLGKSDSSKAAFAAKMVRKALSYLIPRQHIIDNLAQGLGTPGITQVSIAYKSFYPSNVQADSYNPTSARSFLAAAGYKTGVAPPSTGGTISLPPIPSLNVSVPTFLVGNTFTLSGSFVADPVLALKSGGFAVILQQSVDDGKTWKSVTFALTTPGTGAYTISYTPTVTGSVQYRTLFTGIPATYVALTGLGNASLIQAQLRTDFGGSVAKTLPPSNVTQPAYGPTTTLTVGSLADVVNALLTSLSNLQQSTQSALANAATKSELNTLSGQVSSVNTQVNNVSGQLAALTNVAYAALAVAVILGLIAIALAMRKRS